MHFILSGACARLIPGVICLSMQRGRIIVAFLYSPFAGALYLLTFGIVFLHLNQRDFVGVFSVIVLFMIIGYLAELMLGIPLLLLFRRFCLSGLLWFLLGGLVIGIAVWLIVLLWLLVGFGKPDNPFASELVFGLIAFGLLGCITPAIISTAVFWFSVGRQITKPCS